MNKKLLAFYFLLLSAAWFVFQAEPARAQNTTPVPPDEAAVGTWQKFRSSQKNQATQLQKGNFTAAVPALKWECTINASNSGGGEGHVAIGDVVPGNPGNEIVVNITTTGG